MNVFTIPSWYPSESNPIYGIFIKEQVEALARNHPEHNFGVSTWGQGNESNLLWAKDHIRNLSKVLNLNKASEKGILSNFWEYHTATFIWTRKFLKGNKKGIIQANRKNLIKFQHQFGKVDVIHAQAVYPAGYIALALSKEFKIPYVITSRMSPFPFDEFVNKKQIDPIIDIPLKNASNLIAISKPLETRLNELGYKHTTVIHNLANEQFFKPIEISPSEQVIFLTSGRLVPQKGIDILLEAVALTKTKTSKAFSLLIAGEGPEKAVLKDQTKKLELNNVGWLGELNREQTREAIQRCSCFVLASRHETFGNVLTEAIACGKPIIATACGGPEDIVNDTNGLLAEAESPKELADRMFDMIESYGHYDSAAIRKDFEERFSSKVITPRIIDLYREVVA
ncbi:MAG: glycosyltransferase [Cyclobacteriaceae bacterium]